MGVTIINGALSRDQVHMFVEIPPHDPTGLGRSVIQQASLNFPERHDIQSSKIRKSL